MTKEQSLVATQIAIAQKATRALQSVRDACELDFYRDKLAIKRLVESYLKEIDRLYQQYERAFPDSENDETEA